MGDLTASQLEVLPPGSVVEFTWSDYPDDREMVMHTPDGWIGECGMTRTGWIAERYPRLVSVPLSEEDRREALQLADALEVGLGLDPTTLPFPELLTLTELLATVALLRRLAGGGS